MATNQDAEVPKKTLYGDGADYEPHDNRGIEKPTTNLETLIHLLKCSLGTGILAMPQAFHNSGLIVGILFTFIVGGLCTYAIHTLVKCQYILCKRRKVGLLSYPRSLEAALEDGPPFAKYFAPCANVFATWFMIFYQVGVCCVYIVFVASTFKKLYELDHENMDIRVYECIILLPLILINMIKNLKYLAPFSILANIVTFIGLGIIFSYLIPDLPPLSEREMTGEIQNFPLFIGTTLFAVEAVGVVIALENNMKEPTAFGGYFGVLNQSMAVILTLYAIMGAVGYLKFGSKCKGSITLNLPEKETLSLSVNFMMSLAVYISYGLQCYVPNVIIWQEYILPHLKTEDTRKWEYLMRIVIVFVTFILALSVPKLGLIISLFGAFCLSILGIILPSIIEMCVYYPDNYGKFKYILIRDIVIFIIGIFFLFSGTLVSIRDIIKEFKS